MVACVFNSKDAKKAEVRKEAEMNGGNGGCYFASYPGGSIKVYIDSLASNAKFNGYSVEIIHNGWIKQYGCVETSAIHDVLKKLKAPKEIVEALNFKGVMPIGVTYTVEIEGWKWSWPDYPDTAIEFKNNLRKKIVKDSIKKGYWQKPVTSKLNIVSL